MDQRIQRAIALMADDLRCALSIRQIARHVNLTPEHFCRLFKTETGSSPAKYRKWLRLQKARELLETTFLSVKEVMFMVGIKEITHFVRDFEMACGQSPARYRAHYRSIQLNKTAAPRREIKIR